MLKPEIITYHAVIDACARSGGMWTAVEWLSKAQEARLEPEIMTYHAVIDACAKSGGMWTAVEWLSKALEARAEFEIMTYHAVIEACAKLAIWRRRSSGYPSAGRQTEA